MKKLSFLSISLLSAMGFLVACKPSSTEACGYGKSVFERCTTPEERLRWDDKNVQQCKTSLDELEKKDATASKAFAETYKQCEAMKDCKEALPCAMIVRMGVDKQLAESR